MNCDNLFCSGRSWGYAYLFASQRRAFAYWKYPAFDDSTAHPSLVPQQFLNYSVDLEGQTEGDARCSPLLIRYAVSKAPRGTWKDFTTFEICSVSDRIYSINNRVRWYLLVFISNSQITSFTFSSKLSFVSLSPRIICRPDFDSFHRCSALYIITFRRVLF